MAFWFDKKKIDKKERNALLITAFVFALVLTFRSWGAEYFDFVEGFFNLLFVTILGYFCLTFRLSAQKWMGFIKGYQVKYSANGTGLTVGVLVAILTNGLIPILTPGTSKQIILKHGHVGKWRSYYNKGKLAVVASTGLVVCFMLAVIFKALWMLTIEHTTIAKFFLFMAQFNAFTAVFSLLPFELLSIFWLKEFMKLPDLPISDGLYIFSFNKFFYIFCLGFAGIYAALILSNSSGNVILAAILAAVITFIYKFYLARSA